MRSSLVIVLSLIGTVAFAAPPEAARVTPAAATKAADRYLVGLHGGKWRTSYVDRTHAGNARVVFRATGIQGVARRMVGKVARGDIYVGAGGDIVRANTKPGVLRGFTGATAGKIGSVVKRAWNSELARDLRSSKSLITLAGTAVATYVAAQFGFPYEQVLAVTGPAAAGLLAVDVKGRHNLRVAADKLADQMTDVLTARRGGAAPAAGPEMMLEAVPAARARGALAPPAAAGVERAALKADLKTRFRAELGVN